MLIIITGPVGIGKTTVCQKVILSAKNRGDTCGGVITYKAPDKSIIIEDIQTGKRITLASCDRVYTGPCTGKYCFNPEGIYFGIQAIVRGTDSDILVVDELGYLELRGEGFAGVVELVRAGKLKNCILVIRSELLDAFLPSLGGAPLVLETTASNRDSLPNELGIILARAVTVQGL